MRRPALYLPNEFLEAPHDVSLITANSRLARELRYCFDYNQSQADRYVWERPKIQTYETWLVNTYHQLGSEHPELAMFSVVSQDTLMLIAQQQAPNDEVEMHARAIVDAWQLTWEANLWIDWQDIRTTENGELCDDWFTRIRGLLTREQLITVAEIPYALINAIERHDWLPPSIMALGFDEATVAQTNLLNALKTRKRCVDVNVTHRDIDSVSHRLANFKSESAELTNMAMWAREKLSTLGSDAVIGVVVDRLAESRHVVKRCFESAFPEVHEISRLVAIDSGQPFSETRLYHDFITLLRWSCESMPYTSLLQLARSPYFPSMGLFKEVQSWFREHISMQGYRNRLPKAEKGRLNQIISMRPKNPRDAMAFAEATRLMIDLVKTCGYSPSNVEPLSYVNKNAVSAFNDIVERIAHAAAILPRISWHRFVDLFEEIASDQSIRTVSQEAPIQVMSRNASMHLKFDALWVTGVSDADWPAVPRPNPFVPIAMQKRANLQRVTHEQMLVEAETLSAHWRNAAAEVIFSFFSETDKIEAQPSMLLADLAMAADDAAAIEQPPVIENAELVEYGHPWASMIEFDSIREYHQSHGSPIARSDVIAKTRWLKNQAECPFKAWAVHRLGINSPEEANTRFPTPAQRGTIFHKVAEALLTNARTQKKLAKLAEHTIVQTIEDVFAKESVTKYLPKRFAAHERERIKTWIDAWIDFQVNERDSFEVIALEEKIQVELNGLTFTGYIDRIDKTDALDQIVIDHKTSRNYHLRQWDPDKIQDTQMPLYATGRDACDGIAYLNIFRVKEGVKATFQGISEDRELESAKELNGSFPEYQSFTDIRTAWRTRLEHVVDEYLDGHAEVLPVDESICRYCHLENLCRIYEQPAIRPDAETAS